MAGLLFALQFKTVQTYAAKKAAAYLSKELKTTFAIGGLHVKPFKSLVLENLVVLDLDKDTLANFPTFTINLNRFSLKERIADVNHVKIDNGKFYLKDNKDGSSNLDFIINYFDSPSPKVKVEKKKFEFIFDKISLTNFNFKYKNLKIDTLVNGVNFDDINVTELNGDFKNLNTKGHLFQTQIDKLTLKEKSGFYLKNLTALATIDSHFIELKNLLLLTKKTRLTDYYKMQFKRYKDFNNYVRKVKMTAKFKNSYISSSDVAYFAPELKTMKLDLAMDGQISGYVNDLKAKNLAIKAGNSTYLKGNFRIKGLPLWNQTFMDLNFEMAGSNKKDIDQILKGITNNKVKAVDQIIEKFGNINFNGSFTGFPKDFIAYGEFKTKLGRFKSDVNMKIDQKGIPSYVGNVKTFDFNLGELLNEKLLGKISSTVAVKGRGTALKDLKEELNGQVAYLDFNGYRYQNIKLDGTLENKFFDGKLNINDKNIQLNFDGNVNLNPTLPVFNFKASIKNAQLKTLKLYKDSLKIDANFSTNFTGNNLNNIQGNLAIAQIKIANANKKYTINSVQLKANNIGIDRSLTIKSDILDASIKGQYDLNSIVSYYKAIAKTYLPSLTTDIITYKTQIFDFNLKIKNFEPIANLFIPGLTLDNDALLIGAFDSRTQKAVLNGSINRLSYQGVVVNNIIIDESTTAKQLTAIVTADRVDLNDSLYIKNVNISSLIRNDSLALNIKLSNADDANQLDLNGLVEFAVAETAKISILPSSLKINNENWDIQEKVKISLNNGKTAVDNFSLSNKKQVVKVDGVISDSNTDLLTIGFENFSLTTLNPFVKALGLKLNGNLNGKTKIGSVLKSPKIADSIGITQLSLNDVVLGNLTDTSSYHNENKTATIYTQILNEGKETLKITGALDFNTKTIGASIQLAESKLAILSPFLKKIVSNLKGTFSADLSAKGTFEKPQFTGNISFDQATLTVNYLKTTYVLNDKVEVNNTIIALDNFTLKDLDGNEAVANGSVDLNNIDNPDIQVGLYAKNFMSLNTTAKDNPLYFGRAYATGDFSFKGPTDNMDIAINAKTERGTIFNLPLNSSETVSDKDFIAFISKDTTQTIKRANNFNGLTMNLKLRLDPNSLANIYTVLGKLSGKGNAELELNIRKNGDFEMTGDYIIETGVFDFTAQEVINKRFEIRQGGTIRWTGNPSNAQINLKAIYALRASVGYLYTAANRDQANANERLQTEVEMGLSGLLLKPDIKLDIFFPANPAKREEFQAYFSDGNNLDRQALSLIIQRKFAPGSGKENIGQQLGSVGKNTATELIFNQFNNLLSSLNLTFVDINIQSLSEANASFKFFNDRVIVNAGIVDNNKSTIEYSGGLFKASVGKEVEILGLIKKDGSLVGKLSNKPPTRQSVFTNPGVDPNVNITSLGIVYSQQFDTFSEFIKKITGKYRKEQERKLAENTAQQNKEAILNEGKKNPKK